MTDWMSLPDAINRVDKVIKTIANGVISELEGIYEREDETKERIAALEAKVQAQQEQIETLRDSLDRTDYNLSEDVLVVAEAMQELNPTFEVRLYANSERNGSRPARRTEQEQPPAFAEQRWDDAVSAIKGQITPEPEQEQQEQIPGWAAEIAAQCWCDAETAGIEMDSRLATAFAKRLVELRHQYTSPVESREPVTHNTEQEQPQGEWRDGVYNETARIPASVFGLDIQPEQEQRRQGAGRRQGDDKILELVHEVMRNHYYDDNPDYNECDTAQCSWCEEAEKIVGPIPKPPGEDQ